MHMQISFQIKNWNVLANITNKHMMISSSVQKLESAFVWRGAYQRGFHSGLGHGLFFSIKKRHLLPFKKSYHLT